MQELVSDYIMLEDHFMSTNIKKALEQHQSDMAAQQVNFIIIYFFNSEQSRPKISVISVHSTILIFLIAWLHV